MFRLGYNTNGLAHHRLVDAFRLLADLGYGAVALTPDVGELDPLAPRADLVRTLRALANDLDLSLAVETGARFVLDPRRKHRPSLLEDAAHERERRIDHLRRSVDLAADLGAPLVSIWAGNAPDGSIGDRRDGPRAAEELWQRLCAGVADVLAHARSRDVVLAFEPEPGMFVERPAGFVELRERMGAAGEALGLTLDVGHLLVTRDLPVGALIRAHAAELVHVHLDDTAGGVHEHVMFGNGDLDLAQTLSALRDVGFAGMAAVELSRDSHRGAWAAEEALKRLRSASTGSPGA